MATVRELSAPYANFMFGPRHGPGVCRRCFNLIDGYDYCYACTCRGNMLNRIVPISYSVGHEQLHHALACYKRVPGSSGRRLSVQIAAVLWRFLIEHERCVARSLGIEAFPIVTTVPSGRELRDRAHPLRWIVGEAVRPTSPRYRELLRRSSLDVERRAFSPDKFTSIETLSGEPVLLIDDTWTTGANAQSAGAALKAAGAGPVAAVVIGRHVNRGWGRNDERLRALGAFDWHKCVLCAPAPVSSQTPRVPA